MAPIQESDLGALDAPRRHASRTALLQLANVGSRIYTNTTISEFFYADIQAIVFINVKNVTVYKGL